MAFPWILALAAGGLVWLANKSSEASPAPAGAGAPPGLPGGATDLGAAPDAAGVWRVKPAVAAALLQQLAGKAAIGSGDERAIGDLAPGLEGAGAWIASRVALGQSVLITWTGELPGKLRAVQPAQEIAYASGAAPKWAVLAAAPSAADAPGLLGQLGGMLGGMLGGSQVPPGAPSNPYAPTNPYAGWFNLDDFAVEQPSGLVVLKMQRAPFVLGALAQLSAMPAAAPMAGVEMRTLTGPGQGPSAAAWAIQAAQTGHFVLANMDRIRLLAVPPGQEKLAGTSGDFGVILKPTAAYQNQGAPAGWPPGLPTPPAGWPFPAPQMPQGGAAPAPGTPGPMTPPGGPLPANAPGGAFPLPPGMPFPGMIPPEMIPPGMMPAPAGIPRDPFEALPPAQRAAVLTAIASNDPARMRAAADAVAGTSPAAANALRAAANDVQNARRLNAIAEGRVYKVRGYNDLPSMVAQHYFDDANYWREIAKYNGAPIVKTAAGPLPRGWKPGSEWELPPGARVERGLPPLAQERSAPRAPAPPKPPKKPAPAKVPPLSPNLPVS